MSDCSLSRISFGTFNAPSWNCTRGLDSFFPIQHGGASFYEPGGRHWLGGGRIVKNFFYESVKTMDDEFRGLSYSSWRARIPAHWGKRTWEMLFRLAADYPHSQDCWDDDVYDKETVMERKKGWRQLLKSLPFVLTCGICAHHFQKYIEHNKGERLEKALRNRESLLRFLYDCKHEVNNRNGQTSPDFDVIRKRYVPPCERRPSKRKTKRRSKRK